MKAILPKKPASTTKLLFSEFLTKKNSAILEQISKYRKVEDIYERTQYALGRKATFKSTSCSTDKVKINLHGIGATNKI